MRESDTLVLDRYALGLNPRCYEILDELIDLSLGLRTCPSSEYILGFILDGWTLRQIARKRKVHHRTVQRDVQKVRKAVEDRVNRRE